ncbi:unnamed protein product [Vitrella brassicaformis CCMP3155]|uniref:Thyroglobulin type-1 domain-containing protein n=1 Tax=Vitrella brassicaformis (strain CCMP3155) TaxID=1169540 RepID=A0A0G4ENF7_VITBC|nr:unnamed protein product [Vitrella brassicaformis CCMP3155]|eukprot:CEL99377.1 unnamed protein product [Vitrella brassicaformis CCMP3155]
MPVRYLRPGCAASVWVLLVLLSSACVRICGQFTSACIFGNDFEDAPGVNKDCNPPGRRRGGSPVVCVPNILLFFDEDSDDDDPLEGKAFGKCVPTSALTEAFKKAQTAGLAAFAPDPGEPAVVDAQGIGQSILCGQLNEDGTGTAALGGCPEEAPICAKTSDRRFCYCITADIGLFGPLSPEAAGTASLSVGVNEGQPSSLCTQQDLDGCSNIVNGLGVNLDCFDDLPVVDRRNDSGPSAAEFVIGDPNEDPEPFQQLVAGTYLLEDIPAGSWLDTVENVGDSDSCFRIQGGDEEDEDFFFLDLSWNTTEGVTALIDFNCPPVGPCSIRIGSLFLPALFSIQGVLEVVNSTFPGCVGIPVQIELTGAGLVDEAASFSLNQANFNESQRVIAIQEPGGTDVIVTRGAGLSSPGAQVGLGLLTFPEVAPEGCPSLFKQRIFTITTGEIEAGGLLAVTASGTSSFEDELGEVMTEAIFELNVTGTSNATDLSDVCNTAQLVPVEGESGRRRRAVAMATAIREQSIFSTELEDLGGIVIPAVFFPLFKPGQSPDFPFLNAVSINRFTTIRRFNATALANEFLIDDPTDSVSLFDTLPSADNVSVLCVEETEVLPITFGLLNLESEASLDLILKGQLGDLQDTDDDGVVIECRGPLLQTLPAGFNETFIIENGLNIGSIAAVSVDPSLGTIGKDIFVDALIDETDGSVTSLREEGTVFSLSQHNCAGVNMTVSKRIEALIQVVDEEGEEIFSETTCQLGFVQPCRETSLPLENPASVQPGIYQLEPAPYLFAEQIFSVDPFSDDPRIDGCVSFYDLADFGNCTPPECQLDNERVFQCRPDEERGIGLQLEVILDLEELDGDTTPGLLSPRALATVQLRGTVEQVWPPECEGTLVFVEGSLLVGAGQTRQDITPRGLFELIRQDLLDALPDIADAPLATTLQDFFILDESLAYPELLLTSSLQLTELEYTLRSLAEGRTVEECFNAEGLTTVSAQDVVPFRVSEGVSDAALSPLPVNTTSEGDIIGIPPIVDVSTGSINFASQGTLPPNIDVDDDVLTLGVRAPLSASIEPPQTQNQSTVFGRLTALCNLPEEVAIQCKPSLPIPLIAGADAIVPNGTDFATVLTGDTSGSTVGPLSVAENFTLSCSVSEARALLLVDDGPELVLIRVVPLTVVVVDEEDGTVSTTRTDCPITIDCQLPTAASSAAQEQTGDGRAAGRPSRTAGGRGAAGDAHLQMVTDIRRRRKLKETRGRLMTDR